MIRFTSSYDGSDIANRIALIVFGTDEFVRWLEYDKKWEIDPGGNWFLHSEGVYVLSYRHAEKERMDALAIVLAWRLGVKVIGGV